MTDEDYKRVFCADFDVQIVEKMKQWRVPGCAIALVPLGEEPIFKTFHLAGHQPITTKTRFPIASITRLLSTFAIIQALETAGYADPLEVRIKDLLPEFKLSDPKAAELCTVKDIVGHRCNVFASSVLTTRPFEQGVNCVNLVADLPIIRPLREGPFDWNPPMNQLVLPIIELLTGKSFEAYVKEVVLEPLGMRSTCFSVAEAGEDMSVGYQLRHRPDGHEDKMMTIRHAYDALGKDSAMATARLISTAEDMAKLAAFLPESPHFLSMMAQPFRDPSTWKDGDWLIGAGTCAWWTGGHLLLGYNGLCPGFRTQVFHLPELGCGLTVLTHSTEGTELMYWIDAWVTGSLTGRRTEVCDEVCERVEKTREAFHHDVISDCPAVTGSGDELLIGDFYSKSFGSLSFNKDSNVRTRPLGNVMDMPWLPHLYGKVRPLVTSLGNGRYDGCLEWEAGEEQEQGWGKQYAYPYKIHLWKSDVDGREELRLRGWEWMAPMSDDVPPAVFYRV